jgi:sirohydrochlorin cobaltochelatase
VKQAILVVSFGTSYPDTLEKTIGATETAIAQAFPQWEVRRAFTSGKIIRKWANRDDISIDTVDEALNRLFQEGFTRVVVQSTHVMHGEEYEKLVRQTEGWKDRLPISLGMPLLHQLSDYEAVAQALLSWLPQPEEDQALVLMGHGTPHFVNSCYTQLEYLLQCACHRVFIGTVEGYPTLEQVMERIQRQGGIRRLTLAPLMLVAGDHAQNDMAGDTDSWKSTLEAAGYQVSCILQGLGECPGIRQLFVEHCGQAIQEMNLRRGTLYGVGVGPGDPELLTVKAVKTLQRSDVILVPDTGKQNQVALNIVRDYVEGKTLHYVSTPMVRDQAVVQRAYDRCADLVCQMLEEGKQVAYITLGDPSIYSTYLYIQQRVTARGYSAEMIPGIPSFCAAAAKLNCSLCEGNEPLMILPASGESNPKRVNKVYMKAGRSILALQEQLRQQGVLEQASLVENCGLPGEQILPHFGDLQEPTGYFSLVISKEEQP